MATVARDRCPYNYANRPAVHDMYWEGWKAICGQPSSQRLADQRFAAAVPLKA
jgi:hypothetical protein